MAKELKEQFAELQTDLTGFLKKSKEEQELAGTVQAATKANIEKLQTQLDAIDKKLVERVNGEPSRTLADDLKENESVQRLLKDQRGSASFTVKAAQMERKTTITSAGQPTAAPGVLGVDQRPGIVPEVRQTLSVLNIVSKRPTTQQVISFVKVLNPFSAAAMAPEGTLKSENAVTFAVASEKIRTIATYIPATRQILDDFTELESYLRTNLPYYVDLKEEQQILAGDATGENFHGWIPQAVQFAAVAKAGENKIDVIGHALAAQANSLELPPNFIVVNIADWWSIRLTKDNYGRYLLGDPQSNVTPSLFGIDVVPTTSIAQGTFLIGNSTPMASELRERMDTEVLISTEDVDNFRRNMVTVRAEKRAALITYRPNAFVTGTYPAGE